jgi:hypothetical protein
MSQILPSPGDERPEGLRERRKSEGMSSARGSTSHRMRRARPSGRSIVVGSTRNRPTGAATAGVTALLNGLYPDPTPDPLPQFREAWRGVAWRGVAWRGVDIIS